MAAEARVLPPDGRPVPSLAAYVEQGGLDGLKRVETLTPEQVIQVVRQAGLRGRGGAGFPTATKWDGARHDPGTTRYLCCNGAEGEPGTFKDRWILRTNPYQVLEGVLIANYAIGAARAYVCTKRVFGQECARLQGALDEMKQAGVPGVEMVELAWGPDEYLFGEEKALLEVIEGGLPLPRRFPPYIHGLFASVYGGPSETGHNPTVVNNVETLANVPGIVREGAAWFRSQGTATSPGTMVFTLSGDVRRPGIYELPLGVSLRRLIEEFGGGVRDGNRVQAVFPGVANSPLTVADLDIALDFDSPKAVGSALGSAGLIVYDETACLARVAHTFSQFLYVESCNQCPPCKLGCGRITADLGRLVTGGGSDADVRDITDTTSWVEEGQRCALPTSEALVMAGLVARFPDAFTTHVPDLCAGRHDLPLPKMVDYDGQGVFTYDAHYSHKRPDWTYDDEPATPRTDEGEIEPDRG